MNKDFIFDVAIEEGDFDTIKKHIETNKYSLYAKQMAQINGFHEIVSYIERFGQIRNQTGVVQVHRPYDLKSHKSTWHSWITNSVQSIYYF